MNKGVAMANINTSDLRNSRDAVSTDPVTASLGGACAGHVVAHLALAACGAACLPFIAIDAAVAGITALNRQR
jgi:hypothetical protein